MTPWLISGGLLMFSGTLAACVVFLASERHTDRAHIDSLTQAKARLEGEVADLRDLLIGELNRPLTSEKDY